MIKIRGLGAPAYADTAWQQTGPMPVPTGYPATNGLCWVSPSGNVAGHWARATSGTPTPCVNPAPGSGGPIVRDQRGDLVPTGAGVTIRDFELTEGPNAVTYAMVGRLQSKTSKMVFEREMAAIRALTPTLTYSCAASDVNHPGYWRLTTPSQLIPGTFEVLGVPFNIAEPGVTKSPEFRRVYTPNNEQRILIEGVIIARSRQTMPSVDSKASVTQALAQLPGWAMSAPGMMLRSAPPTATELTGQGGFASWIKRGFLISPAVISGHEKLLTDATCPMACVMPACKFPGEDRPACAVGRVPTGGDDPNLPGGCFWWYVVVSPNGQFTLIGKHDDPSWLQRAGAKMAGFMIALGNAVCGNREVIQQQTMAAVAEKCVDKNGKPCVKGTPGCNCITPSAATQGGVGLFNFMAGQMCQAWIGEQQHPAAPMPPIPDPPPVELSPAWTKFVPWILGGLVAGAGTYVATKR